MLILYIKFLFWKSFDFINLLNEATNKIFTIDQLYILKFLWLTNRIKLKLYKNKINKDNGKYDIVYWLLLIKIILLIIYIIYIIYFKFTCKI